jgi:hypothetical protein
MRTNIVFFCHRFKRFPLIFPNKSNLLFSNLWKYFKSVVLGIVISVKYVNTRFALLRVSDGSGALFLRGVSASQKKAGTYSTTRSFYLGSRPN